MLTDNEIKYHNQIYIDFAGKKRTQLEVIYIYARWFEGILNEGNYYANEINYNFNDERDYSISAAVGRSRIHNHYPRLFCPYIGRNRWYMKHDLKPRLFLFPHITPFSGYSFHYHGIMLVPVCLRYKDTARTRQLIDLEWRSMAPATNLQCRIENINTDIENILGYCFKEGNRRLPYSKIFAPEPIFLPMASFETKPSAEKRGLETPTFMPHNSSHLLTE